MSDSSEVKGRILAAALAMIRESDGAQLKAREVARAAGVNAAMINYHFESREGLIQACLESYYADIRALIAERVPVFAAGDREGFYRGVLTEGLQYLRTNRSLARLVLLDFVTKGRPRAAPRETEEPLVLAALSSLGEQLGISEGELRLRLRSLVLLCGRYVVIADDELIRLSGGEDIEDAWVKLTEHLVGLATMWLTS